MKGGNDREGVLVYSSKEHGYVLADKKGKFQKLLRVSIRISGQSVQLLVLH